MDLSHTHTQVYVLLNNFLLITLTHTQTRFQIFITLTEDFHPFQN